MIRFGVCECCSVLKEEVAFLRSLIRPKTPQKFESLPIVTLEADAIMSGNDHQMEISPEEQRRQDDLDSERSRILAGTY